MRYELQKYNNLKTKWCKTNKIKLNDRMKTPVREPEIKDAASETKKHNEFNLLSKKISKQ